MTDTAYDRLVKLAGVQGWDHGEIDGAYDFLDAILSSPDLLDALVERGVLRKVQATLDDSEPGDEQPFFYVPIEGDDA